MNMLIPCGKGEQAIPV